MKKYAFILLAVLLASGLWAQKPFKLQVGVTGYATWVNPDYLEQTVFDFNDGQLPEGWTLESEGDIVEPWHIEMPATNPQLNFPPDGSAYFYAHSDQLNGTDYMKEYLYSPPFDLRGYKRAFVQFDFDYFENWDNTEGHCDMQSSGYYGYFVPFFSPQNEATGQCIYEVTHVISSYFRLRFSYYSRYPNNHFAIDNVSLLGEVDEPVSNNVLGFRLWLDGVLIGDVSETEYQIDTDTLQEYHNYTLSVASILAGGISDTTSFTFYNMPCSDFAGVDEFHGEFIDSTRVKLTWDTPYSFKSKDEENQRWFLYTPDVVTHPGAGYNNGWDVSALHDGLTDYGFNADKEAGFKVMDKFLYDGYFAGLRFYLYEGPTPTSTITGAYLTIYDGDPLNGGNLIGGSESINCLYQGWLDCYEWAHIYRTSEDDFSDVSRPVCYAIANLEYVGMGIQLEPNHTYWFVASFTGSLRDDVHVVPVTQLDETTTGEARIYSEATGWQPMIDSGTQTQQGIAFDIIGFLPATLGVAYSDIFRDGERIAHGVSRCYYVDEDAPHGIHTYSIQNVYENNVFIDYATKSCIQSIEVRPCYPPKDLGISTEQLNGTDELNHLTWNKEDDIPLRDDVKTYYEIYRKHISEQQFTLVGTLSKDEMQESFEYIDTVPKGIYYYRVNDYNVFPTGSCESGYAGRFGDCERTDDVVSGEAKWNGFTDEASIGWGELNEGVFQYDDGVYMASTANVSNQTQWGIMVPFAWQNYYTFIRAVSLYILFDGEYRIRIYEGFNRPETLVSQMMMQLTGPEQWHTVTLDEPYQMNNHEVWIMVSRTSVIQRPIPYAGNDGTSDDGRWMCDNGYWGKANIDGSFMVRAQYSNRVNADTLMQLEEPQHGYLHYNLYRSTDNIDYELIAQIPHPLFNCHVEYFDPHEDPMQECYYYQVTLSFRDENELLCETTPMLNAENPLIDWVEVCGTWNNDENIENKNLALYPNPTTGILTITMDNFDHVEVYDLMGRLLKQSKRTSLDLGRWPQGLYVVKVFDKTGNSIIRKIIKQ